MIEIIQKVDWGSTEMVLGYITTITTLIFGIRERRLNNRLKKVDVLKMLESFLSDDFEQIHKVNDTLKWRLEVQKEEIERLQKENKTLNGFFKKHYKTNH